MGGPRAPPCKSAGRGVTNVAPDRRTEIGGWSMDWSDRRERLRSVVAQGRCIYPGSVFDSISARIAEDLGFEAGMAACWRG